VYPALAVLQTMQDKAQVLWVGGEGGMEARLVERAKVPFKAIPAAGVHGVGWKALPGNASRLVRGYFASRRILKEFKPDVLFFTGGFVAVPMALAGYRLPIALFVPDVEPALALKLVDRLADRVAVSSPGSFRYFKHRERIILTGYPTRADLTEWTRSDACRRLNLHGNHPVVLILGGSRGARSINKAVLTNLTSLLDLAQVIHISGELDWQEVASRAGELTSAAGARYHPYPYLHEEMGAALAVADLVVSRAGASILGEYPLFSLPSILVPYPYAWHYQKVNASVLVQHGAAIVVADERLNQDLLPTIQGLLKNREHLTEMRAASKSLSHPHAASEIGHLLLEMAGEKR
jgi:UDP-N-acetylglucosamine--N-acetylmuramyl-(pentapeptide) pyrophosphoryl-undecaprenol N-acetylglucosamine transferase